jgi:hypothetical protein
VLQLRVYRNVRALAWPNFLVTLSLIRYSFLGVCLNMVTLFIEILYYSRT